LYLHSHLNRNLYKCFSQQKQSQSIQEEKEEQEQAFQFERLFSNLNQATLKREPGW
jgi:tyrosine-specific transport protein